ncbi:MAG TPA: 2-C-methyl-D-erythritol 2,4-cyclodiphosphate synthase [Deltaproteobacteria bacterium]|nr:MAG: 2-C-methyl-D-erythritol 2,4-cyclodiphosphate synthase [Deltaproteobacteria bacterium GWA2_55_82]OGQ64103.1 MAG: 2-C-methyl-D-erythritol 2,4-cyclodiphosphate synthase [Deltaproteobacteria bacterium RIFCSPLOWO2_02_FULL_55_12]OIJ74555.1 MAG: 2-C-methyl-D-erythritol 2,4-cyclodiphosphate synthase [Deltaproteobacteria bacterium GWC2_55_46]HBG46506.1 2-C-methyl-D-erythritol 2,4-cyclodiphosphate synthase [Deltaproteobacteria bacterium]HCY10718.1 2-C-methyl-D-erythritol 2,4-cyclodiphosphate synt
MRVGFGYDVHRLVDGRPLILGGVVVPFEKGLLGHSDADVLLHAIIDALIGAAGLGDIGKHFPPTDQRWKDASSLDLLARTASLIDGKGFKTGNLDSTIVCQSPKLLGFIPGMVSNISRVLKCGEAQVNVKAKTEEGLGFTGSGDGIAAYAVAMITAKEG